MLRSIGERVVPPELVGESQDEERVADWLSRQSTSWIVSALVLVSTFGAMLLFALTHS